MADVTPDSSRTRHWAFATNGQLAGMSIARESRHTLAWDSDGVLYLIDTNGRLIVHVKSPDKLAGAAISGDGSVIAVLSAAGKLSWLDATLDVHRSDQIRYKPLDVALDSRGWYAAVSAKNARAAVLDCHGRHIGTIRSAHPLEQIQFLAEKPELMAVSAQGLVARYELRGHPVWRENIASRVGGFGVDDAGDIIVVAAYAHGLIRFDRRARPLGSLHSVETPWRVSLSADGRTMLVGSLSKQISLLSANGEVRWQKTLIETPVDLMLDPLARYAWCGTEDGTIACYELPELDSR